MVKRVFKMIMSLFNQVSLSTKDVQVIKKNIIYIMNFLMIFIKKKKEINHFKNKKNHISYY